MDEAITVDGNVNIDGKDFEKINLRQKQPDWQTETIPNSLGKFFCYWKEFPGHRRG